jgi:hypothetical protein
MGVAFRKARSSGKGGLALPREGMGSAVTTGSRVIFG